jgi:transposase
VLEDSLSVGEAAKRLSLPKSTLEAWVRAAKTGKLGNIGKNRPLLTEVEVELAKVKRELVAGLLGGQDYWGVRLLGGQA